MHQVSHAPLYQMYAISDGQHAAARTYKCTTRLPASMADAQDDELQSDAAPSDTGVRPVSKEKERRVRNFEEVDRWCHDDHTDEEIDGFIRRHIKDMNDRAGLKVFPGSHKDRNPKYGLMQHGRTWYTRKGSVTNIVLQCPLVDRCSCLCEVKLTIDSDQTIMYVTDEHTAEDHAKTKDISRHLAFEDKCLIQQAVKLAPMQSAGSLMRNIQDSPSKKIDYRHANSVRNFVRKERRTITNFLLDGVEIDNTLGSLSRLSDQLWFPDALEQHRSGQCIELFKPFVIGRQFFDTERTIMLTVSNVWYLLSPMRTIASGYDLQLVGDVTHKASLAAVNKLAFGVNMLGGKAAPWTYTLIPHQSESEAVYTDAYHASRRATRAVMALPSCGRSNCSTCKAIDILRAHEAVRACLASRAYKKDHELPVRHGLCDNTDTYRNFLKHCLKLLTELCQTHATAIPACNGTHQKFFDNQEVYEEFYQMVYELMQISITEAGFHLQNLLVYWLRDKGEARAAAWFEQYWTGEEKGRYLLGCGGIGLVANNQSLESHWRWDRVAISNSTQVTTYICPQTMYNFPQRMYNFP